MENDGITIQAPVHFTEEWLNDIFCDAIDNGITTWSVPEVYAWDRERYGNEWHARIRDTENGKGYDVDRDTIVRGLTRLAASLELRHHWRDVLADNTDAVTSDVVVQLGLFGEVIYS